MTESIAREQICRVGKSLFDRGYVHATAGNISVRLDDSAGGGFLISRWDRTAHCSDLGAVAGFLRRIEGEA